MGLPTEILKFFSAKYGDKNDQGHIVPKSIQDFSSTGFSGNINEVNLICKKFVEKGLLLHMGKVGSVPLLGESYLASKFIDKFAEYGTYDFMIDGFLSIRNQFSSSVLPIIVTKENGEFDIGSAFTITGGYIVTALHCIENFENVLITDQNDIPIQMENIYMHQDRRKDLAILKPIGNPFENSPKFLIGNANILDEVLTMGYPPISGFDSILVSERASINSSLKSSIGNLIGEGTSYLDGQDYMLINAKVKGGNSGGPIIDDKGNAVGMLIQIPIDPKDQTKLDVLGYGIGLHGSEIFDMWKSILTNGEDIRNIQFKNNDNGFRTK